MVATGDARRQLERLATLYGVELSYFDIKGKQFVATDDALFAVLPQLGAEVRGPEDVPAALEAREQALATRTLEPVFIAWDQDVPELRIQRPADETGPVRVQVALESTERFELSEALQGLEVLSSHEVGGAAYATRRIGLGRALPHGYHRVTVELAGERHEALLIAAPRQAWLPEGLRGWGLFAPAYALRSESDLGVGGLAELERLVDLTKAVGGSIVGTLPITATFLRELASPSPYGPVSRLFWSELYIDIAQLPELEHCEAARETLSSDAFRAEVERLRGDRYADHVAAMALLRSVLEPLAEAAFAADSPARHALVATLEADPRLAEYARFRAVIEKRKDSWHGWPAHLAAGEFGAEDFDEADYRYHAYVQVRMSEQLAKLASRAREGGGGLYLDLPLGVHPDGYDAWRFKDQFLSASSAGAPPDDLFEGGQDWGFRPLHPEAIREAGYEYVIACMKKQFACSGALRVDHVMGLHRIFCIPHGLSGDQGLYVQYRAEELYAILTLESHRNRCFIIGEDLGTVPNEVRNSMDAHQLSRMYVAQFSMSTEPGRELFVPPPQAVASVNTHDTPTFAAFWQDEDIATRVRLGHTSEADAREERAARPHLREAVIRGLRDRHVLGEHESTADVLGGILNYLASSEARMLLVNLEDLWGETHSQNVPGTVDEHANWKNRCRHSLEAIPEVPGLFDTLREIDRRRRG